MAVANDIDICNMALDHLGKPPIVSLTEGSVEAQTCVRQYDIARRTCLSKSPWTFARKLRSMSQHVTNELDDLWSYGYDLPNDAVKIVTFVPPGVMPRRDSVPPSAYIEMGSVYLNIPEARCYYVVDSRDTRSWSTLFDDAVSLVLAGRMAPSMTRRSSDVDKLRDFAVNALGDAIEHDAQQEFEVYTAHEGGYIDNVRPTSYKVGNETIWD